MKMTLKEYRKFEMRRLSGFMRFMVQIKLFKLFITDQNVWKNNNDYYSEIRINIYNPLTYIMLLFYIPLAFLINGINPDSYRDIKRELKEQFKKK